MASVSAGGNSRLKQSKSQRWEKRSSIASPRDSRWAWKEGVKTRRRALGKGEKGEEEEEEEGVEGNN